MIQDPSSCTEETRKWVKGGRIERVVWPKEFIRFLRGRCLETFRRGDGPYQKEVSRRTGCYRVGGPDTRLRWNRCSGRELSGCRCGPTTEISRKEGTNKKRCPDWWVTGLCTDKQNKLFNLQKFYRSYIRRSFVPETGKRSDNILVVDSWLNPRIHIRVYNWKVLVLISKVRVMKTIFLIFHVHVREVEKQVLSFQTKLFLRGSFVRLHKKNFGPSNYTRNQSEK